MAAVQPIIEKLGKAQFGMLRAADAVSCEQWKTRPAEKVWSAAELIGHVMTIERAVLGTADRYMQSPPRHFPMIRRVHLPVALAELRLFRVKTPIPLDPALVREKEEMLAELREVRERTLAFIDETQGRDLSVYRWPHPYLGVLNVYDWMEMIAGHEVRHTKQMREIAARVPKGVLSLQKQK
jgi:DinB superfamily